MSTRLVCSSRIVFGELNPNRSLYVCFLEISLPLAVFQTACHCQTWRIQHFTFLQLQFSHNFRHLEDLFFWTYQIGLRVLLIKETNCDFLFHLPGTIFCPSSSPQPLQTCPVGGCSRLQRDLLGPPLPPVFCECPEWCPSLSPSVETMVMRRSLLLHHWCLEPMVCRLVTRPSTFRSV